MLKTSIRLFACLALTLVFPFLSIADELYLLQPGDELEVTVWKEDALTREVVVLPDGRMSYPLVGYVQAAGKSIETLQSEMTEGLAKYIAGPVVAISVKRIAGNVVYILGQVNNPGEVVMTRNLNVIQALSVAGGFTAYADLGDIVVVRGSGSSQNVLSVNYNAIESGKNLASNYTLSAGDVIIVP